VEIKYADWSYSADPERDADEFRYKSRGYPGVFRFVVCDSGGYCLSPIFDYECSRICGLHQLVIRLTVKARFMGSLGGQRLLAAIAG
jgi:hypothetical protein